MLDISKTEVYNQAIPNERGYANRMNLPKLRGKIAEQNIGHKEIGFEIKCSRQTVSNKVNGKTPITLEEAQKLSELLHLTDQDKIDIFLS